MKRIGNKNKDENVQYDAVRERERERQREGDRKRERDKDRERSRDRERNFGNYGILSWDETERYDF